MGELLPGEVAVLAGPVDPAGRYSVGAHAVADEQHDVLGCVGVPCVG